MSNPGQSAAAPQQRTFMGHPVGLYVLFFTEMWERFSFYSMRAFLALYMTKAMALSDSTANGVYGAYLGFVYATTFIGGMLADRLLGQRRCIITGGLLMAAAQFTLAAHSFMLQKDGAAISSLHGVFFLGLSLLAAGNGFFKPNISTIVGSLYPQGDVRRDGAFTIFYMGINIGAALAGFSGQFAESYGWHWGFLIAGVGMLFGQIIFQFGLQYLEGKGLPPVRPATAGVKSSLTRWTALIVAGVAVFIPGAAWLMSHPEYVQNIALIIAPPVLIYLLWEASRGTREERGRMLVLIVMCSFSMMFWAFFELAGSAVNLFTDRYVDRSVSLFGWTRTLGASLLTAQINPIFIILLGIPFARLWVWLDKRRLEPSSPLKFALGLAQLAAGFFVFYLGAKAAGPNGKCNMSFLVLGFFLHTTGELCLSPVGLSTVTKLSPARLVGMFMGVWFLASALGNVFGGMVGHYTEKYGFMDVFFWIGVIAAAAAALLFILVPGLKKMMYGVK